MNNEISNESFIYRIDKDNRIISVSDNWQGFAANNDCPDLCQPDKVIGSKLIDHITGLETKHLYEILIKRARDKKQTIKVSFRCDSPECRRFLTLEIVPHANEVIEFISTIIKTEQRAAVDLIAVDQPRNDQIIKICSVCKKIQIEGELWLEAEDAINKMQLFKSSAMPCLSHGLCRPCYEEAMAELD